MGAQDEGLSVLLLESTGKWGGNTAMSGGGMWLPNNPLMQRDGAGDSREEALTYLEATVGDVGPASREPARKLSSTAWPTSSQLPRSMASSWCEPVTTRTTTPSCRAARSAAPSR